MVPLNLNKQIQSDIKRYTSLLKKYKSGKAKTGEVASRGRIIDRADRTDHVARHLENVIRELGALLRDG